ncbi:hypothetical protein EV361DRAFT_1037781 [Lentinula raphanica]|nr:hypothetical protein EV361DRAFT_1037781 [Lentinula raphanica]
MDEKGVQLGGGQKNLQRNDNLQLVTIIDSVCADRMAPIKPAFVFPGAKMYEEWMGVEEDIMVATSDNGWTDNEIGFQWFKKCKSISFSWCFGPLQTAWFNYCDEIMAATGEAMSLRDVVKEYWECQKQAFKDTTIKNSWRKSGINPLDPEIFTEADYASSIPTSTETHLPKSFPRQLHCAPDVGSDDASFDPVVLLARAESRMEEQGETDESDDTEYSPNSDSVSVRVLVALTLDSTTDGGYKRFVPTNVVDSC